MVIHNIKVKPNIVPNIIPDSLFFISKYAAVKFENPFTISKEIPEKIKF